MSIWASGRGAAGPSVRRPRHAPRAPLPGGVREPDQRACRTFGSASSRATRRTRCAISPLRPPCCAASRRSIASTSSASLRRSSRRRATGSSGMPTAHPPTPPAPSVPPAPSPLPMAGGRNCSLPGCEGSSSFKTTSALAVPTAVPPTGNRPPFRDDLCGILPMTSWSLNGQQQARCRTQREGTGLPSASSFTLAPASQGRPPTSRV